MKMVLLRSYLGSENGNQHLLLMSGAKASDTPGSGLGGEEGKREEIVMDLNNLNHTWHEERDGSMASVQLILPTFTP